MKRGPWRGVCAACAKDVYGDPLAHYTSDAHHDNVRRWELPRRWKDGPDGRVHRVRATVVIAGGQS